MERGDTGLGRDAYGLPRRERDRRGYGPGPYPADDGYLAPADYEEDDAAGSGRPADVEEDEYGQLLHRPGDLPPRQRLRQQGRPSPGRPGRFPPGVPPDGGPPGGIPPYARPPGGMPYAAPPGGMPHAGAPDGGAGPNGAPGPNGGPPGSGPGPGSQYRLPNGRRPPPNADRPYRPPGPSMPGGTPVRHHRPGPAIQEPYAGGRSRLGPAPGAPPPSHGTGGAVSGGHGPGGPQSYAGSGGTGGPGAPPLREHAPIGPRSGRPDDRERLGPAPEPPGPVIRQREAAVPGQPSQPAQPVASIAPDGLEAFARDLRALRAKANLDYPEMAEISHYEMKTLAAAAGGLRVPTLPVAVAFVRACGGNVAEWEERWQKLAEKITAEAAGKRRNDGEDHAEPVEPADTLAAVEPPARNLAPSPPPDSDGGEVYVITSVKPREPGW